MSQKSLRSLFGITSVTAIESYLTDLEPTLVIVRGATISSVLSILQVHIVRKLCLGQK